MSCFTQSKAAKSTFHAGNVVYNIAISYRHSKIGDGENDDVLSTKESRIYLD